MRTSDFQLDPNRHYEFVAGEWHIRPPQEILHSQTLGRMNRHLGEFVDKRGCGQVYLVCSYQIGADERIIDLSFISAARIPPSGVPATKWILPPDLAIEVISPIDLHGDVYRRLDDYLAAKVKQVWLVNPFAKEILVFRSRTDITAFVADAELTCEDLLPGFRLSLSEVFRNIHVPMQN